MRALCGRLTVYSVKVSKLCSITITEEKEVRNISATFEYLYHNSHMILFFLLSREKFSRIIFF